MPEPKLIDFNGDFRINLYRGNDYAGKAEVKSGSKKITKKTKEHYAKILEYLDNVTSAKAPEIAEQLKVKSTRANELL